MQARHLLAIDIVDVAPIITALLNRLGLIARELNCTTIRLATEEDGSQRWVGTQTVVALQLHTKLDKLTDISFATDLLCRNEAGSLEKFPEMAGEAGSP